MLEGRIQDLFGGAIQCMIPTSFLDVRYSSIFLLLVKYFFPQQLSRYTQSSRGKKGERHFVSLIIWMRQVFADGDTDQSIIIEINEIASVENDAVAK